MTSPKGDQASERTRLDREYANVSSYKRPQKHNVFNDCKLDSYIQKCRLKKTHILKKTSMVRSIQSLVHLTFSTRTKVQ